MELDFEAMQTAANKAAEDSKQAFDADMDRLQAAYKETAEELANTFSVMADNIDKAQEEEMQREIERKTAEAAEAVRAEYARKHPASWNESDREKAWRDFSQGLK